MAVLAITVLIGVFASHKIAADSRTNFHMRRFELCNKTQGLIKYEGNITVEPNGVYTSNKITFPFPLDENIGCSCKIETKVTHSFVELFTIREKYFCLAANTYLGEFWYDIERAAQIMPRQCPIRAGRYELHHYRMDFNRVALQTFPFGRLRFTAKMVDNRQPENKLLCVLMEVDNIPN